MNGVMIVTGASRGIGASIARLAGARGFDVCVNYNASKDRAEEVVAEIEKAGARAIAVAGDMANESDIVGLFEATDEAFGPLTALVSNAAIDHETLIESAEVPDVERVFRVNVTALFIAAREAIRRMSTKHGGSGGSIVHVSSISPRTGGVPGDVIYTASKGAVDGLTRGLAKEVGKEGIRVNSLRPGITLTEIFDHYSGGREAAIEIAKATSMLGRIGQPDEVAELAVWLASDAASYVTGANFDVSGGR